MATLTYNFTPGQNIWVIYTPTNGLPAVVSGKVIQFKPVINLTISTNFYDIRLQDQNGTTQFIESEIFATLADALTEYENILT